VAFPNLFNEGGSKVLPTYISHLITSQQYPLSGITVQNTGPATSLQVSIDLPNYGSAFTQTLSLSASQSQTITLSPNLNYAQLFQLTTAVPAALNVSVLAGGLTLFQQSYPIDVSGRDTVFWSNNGQPTMGLIATMVTPNDGQSKVALLLRNAASRFPSGMLGGYQLAAWPSVAYTMSPGYYEQELFLLLQGESPTVTIESVTNGLGGSDTATVAIMDDANFQAFAVGSAATACASTTAATSGTILTCTTPVAGKYHIVYLNPSTNFTSRTITRHRPMTKWETTYQQTKAIFQQLRAQGMTYVNLPGTGFFSASQNVMYPAESLALQSANCIEGALVFASAWERMGMEPVLALDSTHGHAFAAIRCWQGTDCVIPVETTMVGGSATFDNSVTVAIGNWTGWASTLQLVDIKAARAAAITPAPM
jgi:hypothetical protein